LKTRPLKTDRIVVSDRSARSIDGRVRDDVREMKIAAEKRFDPTAFRNRDTYTPTLTYIVSASMSGRLDGGVGWRWRDNAWYENIMLSADEERELELDLAVSRSAADGQQKLTARQRSGASLRAAG
jgi:hypothetical protein